MSKTGHYPGGSTKVWISSNGTRWEAGERAAIIDDYYDRWDKRDQYEELPGTRARKRQRKEFQYWMNACARAYIEDRLSPTFPRAPSFLRKAVAKAGGNTGWLTDDRARAALLVQLVHSLQKGASAASSSQGAKHNPSRL